MTKKKTIKEELPPIVTAQDVIIEEAKLNRELKESRRTGTQKEEQEIENLAKELRMQGLSDEEADKQARSTVLKAQTAADQAWHNFMQKIKLHEVLDDILKKSLQDFAKKYNTLNPQDNISFELRYIHAEPKGTNAFAAGLQILLSYQGTKYTLVHKEIGLPHIKDARKEREWKYKLYNLVWDTLIFNGLTLFLIDLKYKLNNGTTTTGTGETLAIVGEPDNKGNTENNTGEGEKVPS